MWITTRRLRQLIQEVLEDVQASNPLEGEYAGYIIAYDSKYNKKWTKTLHRRVSSFLESQNRDLLSPTSQKDLLTISQQLRAGFSDPDLVAPHEVDRIKQVFKNFGIDDHLAGEKSKFFSPLGLSSNITGISSALERLLAEPDLSDYQKRLYVKGIDENIREMKKILDSVTEEEIIDLKRLEHAFKSIVTYLPRLNKSYKETFTALLQSGRAGIIQASELLDSLNMPDVREDVL